MGEAARFPSTGSTEDRAEPPPQGHNTSPVIDTSGGTAAITQKFNLLHKLQYPQLLNYVTRLTLGDRRQAEDIVQETFVRAWKHLVSNEGVDLDSFRPWLYTVARRLVVDMIRALRSRPTEVVLDDAPSLFADEHDSIAALLSATVVKEALMRLRSDQREILIDLYYHGRTAAEIAHQLDIPIGTVKSRAYYAKQALRVQLDL